MTVPEEIEKASWVTHFRENEKELNYFVMKIKKLRKAWGSRTISSKYLHYWNKLYISIIFDALIKVLFYVFNHLFCICVAMCQSQLNYVRSKKLLNMYMLYIIVNYKFSWIKIDLLLISIYVCNIWSRIFLVSFQNFWIWIIFSYSKET